MENTVYKDVLVLAYSEMDTYFGRATGSSEKGFEGEWVNVRFSDSELNHKKLFGFTFIVVENAVVNNIMEAGKLLI